MAPMVPVIGSDPSIPFVIRPRLLGGAISISQDGPPAPVKINEQPRKNLPTRSIATRNIALCQLGDSDSL